MAIYHLSMKPIARNSGRSAVAAAAYRSGSRLVNERDGLVHDYSRKSGIAHAEIITPDGVNAEWAHDRSALWNAAEFAEKRKDARVAREFEVALPHELSDAERLDLTRAFAQSLANRFGTAVDFAIHSPDDATDIRNHHAHIMMTTRAVTPDGLAAKTALERENKYLIDNGLPTSQAQLRDVRLEWEQLTNEHLARAGRDVRVDHRSHLDRGLELEPTQHMGVHASQMQSHGKSVERARIDAEAAKRNADLIREKPDTVLSIITNEKSVFDKRDIARTLHRYINDDPAEYQVLLARIMASPQLTKLRETDGPIPAKYSTKEMVEVETGMAADVLAMSASANHPVDERHIYRAIQNQDQAIQRAANAQTARKVASGEISEAQAKRDWKPAGLSTEQIEAIEHVTSDQQISLVVGYAGAGKSTILAAAREAWEAQGYSVHGAALAGKAAEGLEESSGISSRTLASWAYRWNKDENLLGPKDVLVIDEAGMVGSRQLSGFISEAREAGAKIVLVGDHEQLQAIGAGAAFRSIAESVGFAQLSDVRRQREDWQREASVALASHRTSEALEAYDRHGHIHVDDTADRARARLVDDYIADVKSRPDGTRMAMAHRKVDVQALNAGIRDRLRNESECSNAQMQTETRFQTENGERDFAAGDRLVFLANDRKLGVRNGQLGTVERVGEGRLTVRPDGKMQAIEIDAEAYKAFDYGYATTIHKTQGATVDKAYVFASSTMDRHLTYVAMTRHRDAAEVYADREAFRDIDALKSRLSRSGAKETTLDYLEVGEGGFAARRGFDLGADDEVRSVERDRAQAQSHAPVSKRGGLPPEKPAISPADRDRLISAIDRFADSYHALVIKRLTGRNDNMMPPEMHAALSDLDAVRPGARDVLMSAFKHDPDMHETIMTRSGLSRTQVLLQGIGKEAAAQKDPNVRADRAIKEWHKLSEAAQGARSLYGDRARLERDQRAWVKSVKDDPEMAKVIAARGRELGLGYIADAQDVGREFERQMKRDRDRDRGRER